MHLKGYIKAIKENSFTIPVYGDGENCYCHTLDDSFSVTAFYSVELPQENFNKLYLSHEFKIGSVGAVVFIGEEDYRIYHQANMIIDEIINYLRDTTVETKYLNIKKEVQELKQTLSRDLFDISVNMPLEEQEIVIPGEAKSKSSSNIFVKYSLEEYMDLENDLLSSQETSAFKESLVYKYLEKTIFDKDLYASNREVLFSLFRNYLEENHSALEEIIFDSRISNGFTSYLNSNNFVEVSPVELTIEETLKFRADERRKKLKEFNYRFIHSTSYIADLEKIPAYKRAGIELEEIPAFNKKLVPIVLSIETKKDSDPDENPTKAIKTTANIG